LVFAISPPSGAALIARGASSEPVTSPSPWALAELTAGLLPADHPPRPLYLRAPDAVVPTRLPGQPRPAAITPEA
jgi:tRNA threonylcarbamoyladenosine biosynthesis protein TsaB